MIQRLTAAVSRSVGGGMPRGLPEVEARTVHSWLETRSDVVLVDVREPHEKRMADIGGIHVPLREIPRRIEDLRDHGDKTVVVYCRSGMRSKQAVAFLRSSGFETVLNLKGGIVAWSREVDPSVPIY